MINNRINHIPPKYRERHDFCFHLHDQMAHLLIQMENQKAAHVRFDLQSENERHLLNSDINILDFLNNTGRIDLERRITINSICMALYSDMLHFIYEGLIALEKRKFTVAFTLLRKPFKEGLLIVSQICADEEKFFERLKYDVDQILNRHIFTENEIKSLLQSALQSCNGSIFIDAGNIFESIYNRKNKSGLAESFDKATHLITTFSQIQTENYNLNFIFRDPLDDDIYAGDTYRQIATILLLLNLFQIELYSRMQTIPKWYEQWLLFTSIGVFESLFTSGKSRTASFVNKIFANYLFCPLCHKKMKIKKIDIPKLFIFEQNPLPTMPNQLQLSYCLAIFKL